MVSTRRSNRTLATVIRESPVDVSEKKHSENGDPSATSLNFNRVDSQISGGSANVESAEEESLSGPDDISAPSKKRARSNQVTAKNRPKKYVRGKQGGLQGLMKMPIEIFNEIAYLLTPGDLLSLARSSRFFRSMLLQRSAVQMWRHAESSVHGLPPCPPDMCEPQYAALMFSKYCTLCGASATAKVDAHLAVRLCSACRDTQLQELNTSRPPFDLELVHYSMYTRPKREKSQPRLPRHTVFGLKHEVEEVRAKQDQLRRTKDQKGLDKWEREKKAAVLSRNKHARLLVSYIEKSEHSREVDLDNMKQQRRKDIVERLKALGWTDKDMTFDGPPVKPWSALVDAPKPLTDRIWTNILPKLTEMLEENRELNITNEKKHQRLLRRMLVDKFLMHMKYTTHPFEAIFETLGVPTPLPPDLTNRSGMIKSFLLQKASPETPNPFPKTQAMLDWDCLRDLSEVEMSLEEVGAKLEERKAEIEEKALEWRTLTERQLVQRLTSETSEYNKDVVLKVKGTIEPTSQLSRNTRLLLRADTIFKREMSNSIRVLSASSYTGLIPDYYPNFVSSKFDGLKETVFGNSSRYSQETDLNKYVRDTEAEEIAKLLLLELDMPDASHIELQVLRARFVCGRCVDKKPKTWIKMVGHYLEESTFWDVQKDDTHHAPVRHPILVRHLHALEATDNAKPLIRLLAEDEATSMTALAEGMLFSWPCCYLCEATGRRSKRLSKDDILVHMLEVHDVTEPVEGVYYGANPHEPLENTWHEEWDKFHDARATVPGSSVPKS
ncbi:hypothetical protein FRC12_010796 [Ceratobasidium sp. 428]|nr:hypothetical protein FRC12_010796 [Ceratobasidium sp. 428]